ncbi:unnamed protein product [Pipistrellus nathusii]|uniref:Protein unc-93 homolog A n=1 Tax=Pipistrellus nathusii TaxID=59473 RepID=A0ABP0A9J8_PIPNA
MDRSLRNVLVVSLGFLLLFTAYSGLQNLQSSLYSHEGLGVTVLSTLYGAMMLSSMLLPPLLIRALGCKWTIVLAMGCYVAFSLGNFYASWYTLIPTSILLGLGAAPLWSAGSTYLTVAGNAHAESTGQAGRNVVNQYFGIFYLMFQFSGVWGNLISSLVFGQEATKGSGVLAVLLVALFLDPIRDTLHNGDGEKPSVRSTVLSTFQLLRDRRLRLLLLLPMYSGFEQAFMAGDYTRSYVTCALGIRFVGYVMICFSASTGLCSMLYGRVAQYTGRPPLYALGAVTHLSCIVALLLWAPRPNQLPVFFVFSGLWGVADAVWQTQNNVLFGVLFDAHKEAAFATYRMWEALGWVVAFGYSKFLCVHVKLYILLAVLSAATLGYTAVEVLEARARPGPTATATATTAEDGETQTTM